MPPRAYSVLHLVSHRQRLAATNVERGRCSSGLPLTELRETNLSCKPCGLKLSCAVGGFVDPSQPAIE